MFSIKHIGSIFAVCATAVLLSSPAQASHPSMYIEGDTVVLKEPTCITKEAVVEIQKAAKGGFSEAVRVFVQKQKAGLCDQVVEATIGKRFGEEVISDYTYILFEATRTDNGETIYAIGTVVNID